jgi:aspartyl-tRNA(Asn)/glutamyl-tRNA(Gln) amidotransferase subunit A
MATEPDPELLRLTLEAAAAAVAREEVRPIELVDACLSRIASLNDQLLAYITVFEDEARAGARASEAMLRAGYRLGPLHGVPIALKDNIGVARQRTTAGSKILADWLPDTDATVAARLRSAGAILIGKTNMDEFAHGGSSANQHYGSTRNPWDVGRTPAGSSGGSAVAVAARTCFGALGTDTDGSVRLPASATGIVGMRPTLGRVSNEGVIPLAWSMDTVGPMARTVLDCATILEVIAGYDPGDPTSKAAPTSRYTAALEQGIEGLRIGVILDYSLADLQPAVGAAIRTALETLEHAGGWVVPVEIPDVGGAIPAQRSIELCESSAFHQRWLRERADDYGDDVRTLLLAGEKHLAVDYIEAQRFRDLLRGRVLAAFDAVDVLVCPAAPFTAARIGATTVVIDDDEEDLVLASTRFTGISSLTGLPALTVPCGFDGDGLPSGMQLIGRPFGEATLFRVGAAFQRVTDFHTRVPPLGEDRAPRSERP